MATHEFIDAACPEFAAHRAFAAYPSTPSNLMSVASAIVNKNGEMSRKHGNTLIRTPRKH